MHYEKFQDGTVKCIEDEIPFDVPEGWAWTRLSSLAQYRKGPFGSSLTKAMFIPESPTAIKVYEQKNAINKDATLGTYYISEEKYESMKSFEVFPNDIIVSCAGTIGETFVMPQNMRKGIINQALMKISLYDLSILQFYMTYFDFVLKGMAKEQGYGNALKNIPPFDVLKNYLIPLPPLNEQVLIHKKLSQAIDYVDSLDDKASILETTIGQGKSKILKLAIQGKLVPQNPADEPASVLLERIRAEKEELIKQGKIKRDKNESVIFKGDDNSYYIRFGKSQESVEERLLFELPENWQFGTLYQVASIDLGKTLDKAKNTGNYFPYLRSVNVRWNSIDLSDVKEMKFEKDELEKYSVQKSDLLICEGGDVGRCCVWNEEYSIQYQNALHRVRLYQSCNSSYFMYYLMYYESLNMLKQMCAGVTIKHLTGNVLSKIPFAIPPIDEQMRIVKAIDESFAYLDSISKMLL